MHPTPLAEAVETGVAALPVTLAPAGCAADTADTGKDVAKVGVGGLLSRVARGRRPALRP